MQKAGRRNEVWFTATAISEEYSDLARFSQTGPSGATRLHGCQPHSSSQRDGTTSRPARSDAHSSMRGSRAAGVNSSPGRTAKPTRGMSSLSASRQVRTVTLAPGPGPRVWHWHALRRSSSWDPSSPVFARSASASRAPRGPCSGSRPSLHRHASWNIANISMMAGSAPVAAARRLPFSSTLPQWVAPWIPSGFNRYWARIPGRSSPARDSLVTNGAPQHCMRQP